MIWRPPAPRLPSEPFVALAYEKYAFIPTGIGAYEDAGPLSGKVPPSTIDRLVMPGSACAPASAVTHAIAATTSTAVSAPNLLFMLLSLLRWPGGVRRSLE